MELILKHGFDLLCPQPNNFDDSTVLWIADTFNYDDLDQLIKRHGKPKYIVNENNFGHFGKKIFVLFCTSRSTKNDVYIVQFIIMIFKIKINVFYQSIRKSYIAKILYKPSFNQLVGSL